MKFEVKVDIFDNFLDAICIVNEDLFPIYFNSSFSNFVEVTSMAGMRKKKIYELIRCEDFDWDRLKAGTKAHLESPSREVSYSTKTRQGRIQLTWSSLRDADGSFRVLIYIKDVSLEDVLARKYHDEILKKEETIKALDRHLFQISLIRDVLERTTTFDDPLVMLRNLFAHLSSILHYEFAIYYKQETSNSLPQMLVNSNTANIDGKLLRDLSEEVKPHLLDDTLTRTKIGGYHWVSFRYVDEAERPKFFVFANRKEMSFEEENLLETICEPLSFSMDNRELFKKAMTDEMTDLYNHRYFMVRFENELREHIDRKKAIGLLLLDVDFFKKVNDTYGHLVGDQVLRATSLCIKNFCRSTDVPARYGGEEFAIILTEIDESGILSVGERLRQSIESMLIPVAGIEQPLKITASIGLSYFPSHGRKVKDLIASADQSLYDSKRNGRNRVTMDMKKVGAA